MPPHVAMDGRWCRIEPLERQRHADDLFDAYGEDSEHRCWTYLGYGPFANRDDYLAWMRKTCLGDDPMFYAIRDVITGRVGGVASHLRIHPDQGSIEVGHICYAPCLQRSCAGTEAMYLMMKRAFDLGYRRYEWKCDALNAASRRAASRYGFQFEGIFRQAMVYKDRNRDSAWYSILDGEWPEVRDGFENWLAPENFRPDGTQLAPIRRARPGGG